LDEQSVQLENLKTTLANLYMERLKLLESNTDELIAVNNNSITSKQNKQKMLMYMLEQTGKGFNEK